MAPLFLLLRKINRLKVRDKTDFNLVHAVRSPQHHDSPSVLNRKDSELGRSSGSERPLNAHFCIRLANHSVRLSLRGHVNQFQLNLPIRSHPIYDVVEKATLRTNSLITRKERKNAVSNIEHWAKGKNQP
jgi:hypothetical protein